MPLFALPLSTASRSATSARAHLTSGLPTRKRKRASPSSSEDEPQLHQQYGGGLPAASTNPLSLTPDEIAQYQLAGLELDEGIPNAKAKKKDRKGKGKASDTEDEDKKTVSADTNRPTQGPRLKMQHLSVLTAILQRCLQEGDIPRASRAWAMLLRAQVGGLGVDIRETGYWAIGAELLMRSSETKAKNRFHANEDSDYEADDEDDMDGRAAKGEVDARRWGTTEGLEKVKAYYERLILQYPYKRQFHGSVNALDFWPAMLSCEIYGMEVEEKQSLMKIAAAEERDENQEGSDSDSDDFQDAESHVSDEEDGGFAAEQKRKERLSRRRAEKRWLQRDGVRHTALNAAEAIAARMDELMTTPPFSDSQVLLRLRGMLAICIGQHSIPAMPIQEEDDNEDIRGSDPERRFLFRQRVSDHERGKKRLEEEEAKARKLFERISKNGVANFDLSGLYLGNDQVEMEVDYDD
ncbi:hypothetical protein LSUE1_G008372 [Lachnellula suecica]|uniref:Uncharacterized protein n=1 Tax=Lachnellula suecica TaxID=602035 RepID=A0A8T9BXR2_9HELO|nr:hypothetical protein LSUE1_G008372 [Lachnellula suecica]